MVVTDHVYRTHTRVSEGILTEIRKSMVNSVTLAEVAVEAGIGPHLLLGRGEEQSGGRLKPSILADAVEAIIGATYLHGGFEAAQRLVLGLLGDRLSADPLAGGDHKSRLQELAAQRFGSAPRYLVEASGPDHARSFDVQVLVEGEVLGRGEGRSKKQAEQVAARAAWEHLADDADRTRGADGSDATDGDHARPAAPRPDAPRPDAPRPGPLPAGPDPMEIPDG
jgi:ribonuclease III